MQRHHRLRRNRDFQRVRRNGKFQASPILVLAFLQTGADRSRFGFVVNKRLGNAVERNKIKRRTREAVQHRLAEIKPGFDVVFIARQPIRRADYQDIAATVDELLHRADLLR